MIAEADGAGGGVELELLPADVGTKRDEFGRGRDAAGMEEEAPGAEERADGDVKRTV